MSAHVVVVGAGYAGLSAAKGLRHAGVAVTVVNPRAEFVERIRLHQLVAGNHGATRPMASLLPRGTEFVADHVRRIDAGGRVAVLAGGGTLAFDHLVYAVGSRGGLDTVPGAREHAVAIGTLPDAETARRRLADLPAGSSVTVVGAGLTGLELATELAERGDHRIRLVGAGPLAPSVGEKARSHLRRRCAALGVEVVEQLAVTEVQQSKIVLADGRALDSDLTVVTATVELPGLARDSGLAVDAAGALRVDAALVGVDGPAVVGAGDAARIDGNPLRMSCQAAIPLGAHAAETVLHLLAGSEPKPVRPKFTGQCISLGRRSGLIQHAGFDDVPTSLVLTGRAAALVKEQVCASTVRVGVNPRWSRFTYSWS
jgi:NADH:ubiquinone reductase (H+-translocating)